ncbi:MAG TPA: large-conductance mechanosensitive channel protein MscL [Candidatus Intestinimonas stercoravium]|uniref:large-conductance mechanosensitive channel protein MscL n=1 Tax=uncultured Intestinimonas sp. TaxID=1689265 RepID=UPI001F8CB87C|nr:large-conductance mechanosensitive channel protein MscL [uncultured Intestinimonas sp.]HJA62731.1 large-conductance mechanosensitive channel protein MscL [Candidatus Intestinimonas stercoravium]
MAEFRKFIARGNVLDMAVGVIIGGAFGKISTSLVNDVLMPAISMLTGGIDFTDWKLVLKEAVVENGEEIAAAVSINYGAFLSTVLDFLIIAFAVFCLVKGVGRLQRRREEAAPPPAPPEPSAEEKLLTEIRDLLRQQSAGKEEAHG